jgi:release factor glutamine methyltransferase
VTVVSVGSLLDALTAELTPPGVPPSRTRARDLIADVLDRPRYWPTAHGDAPLTPDQEAMIREAAARLKAGMPLQYAVGRASFRHLTLAVDPRVLIPRPETELLVELVLAAQRGGKGTVVDVGTGSGAIALALAAEGAFEAVIATDVSPDALDVARANLSTIPEEKRARVSFREGDLLAPIGELLVDTIVSNPPYISPAERDALPLLVRQWEPHLALFSAEEGMAAIRALVPQAAASLRSGGLFAMEIDARRATLAAEAVSNDGRFADVELRPDLTGRPRFVVARREERATDAE